LLAEGKPTAKQASFMAQLIEPQKSIRMHDWLTRGKPSEPFGWDVRSAYALTLIRNKNDKQARHEISTLHDQVSVNHAQNLKGSIDYGPEAGSGRYRNYVGYLQLCEILHALQAVDSKNHNRARKHIKNTRKLRKTFSPEASPLVAEIEKRIQVQTENLLNHEKE
jgi:hypothetical protein